MYLCLFLFFSLSLSLPSTCLVQTLYCLSPSSGRFGSSLQIHLCFDCPCQIKDLWEMWQGLRYRRKQVLTQSESAGDLTLIPFAPKTDVSKPWLSYCCTSVKQLNATVQLKGKCYLAQLPAGHTLARAMKAAIIVSVPSCLLQFVFSCFCSFE